ncbi:hypothetical protein BSY18_4166 (plasmid) [Blastomonas sp. RAC04]|nr:hypothetical protein BSY18_4166 [Blastomonas sp. RAC04]
MLEHPRASSAPEQQLLIAVVALEFRCCFDQHTEDHGSIIARELDQFCLGDEPAKLDQLARAFAALHSPVSHVMLCPVCQQTVARLDRSHVCHQCLCQLIGECWLHPERTQRRVCARPPFVMGRHCRSRRAERPRELLSQAHRLPSQ